MLCIFDPMSLNMQLNVLVCFSLKLQVATPANTEFNFCFKDSYDKSYRVSEVTEGYDNCISDKFCQSVKDRIHFSEVYIVNLLDSLNCIVPEFLIEEWPRPPLRA